MKRVILGLVIVAVIAVIGYKLMGKKPEPQPIAATSSASVQGKSAFYLFL